MKKIFLRLFLLIFLVFILSSCSKKTISSINFENFSLQISDTFKEINSSNIDNKQIGNKLIKAYSYKNKGGYTENILIGKSELPQNINLEEFSKVNIEKIKNQILGYKYLSSNKFTFKCNNENIDSMINNFYVTNKFFEQENEQKNYIAHIYFFYKGNSYIVSYITDNESNLEKNGKYLKKISCK